ncbi:uncharacterized protein [Symphalangus syndactylus]|uniref:uncharacterized protein n=1 Tax=Symphalangus syndactylus TaxID=9590 RepID=UPI0030043C68
MEIILNGKNALEPKMFVAMEMTTEKKLFGFWNSKKGTVHGYFQAGIEALSRRRQSYPQEVTACWACSRHLLCLGSHFGATWGALQPTGALWEPPSGLAKAGAGSLSLQGGLEGEARAATGAARGACRPAGVPGGRGLGGPLTQSSRPALPAPGNEGLSTRARGCGGRTGSPSSASPPALRSISHQTLAVFPRGRTRDLQPAMPEPPTPSTGSCVARAFPTSATPCSTAPSPIDHPRAEECKRTAQDWRAAPPTTPVQDPLGEASWVPESGGDVENLYV